MLGQVILLSLIQLLPVSAVDAETPRSPPVQTVPGEPPPELAPAPLASVPPERTSAVYFVSGLGAPLGFAGFEVAHHLGSIFEISGGLGLGLDAIEAQPHAGLSQILQWAVMPRLRFGNRPGAFTAGAGISGGNDGFFCWVPDTCVDGTYPLSYYVWANFELGMEVWTDSGFAFRAFGGYAHGWCLNGTCENGGTDLPYLGLGVGYAF